MEERPSSSFTPGDIPLAPETDGMPDIGAPDIMASTSDHSESQSSLAQQEPASVADALPDDDAWQPDSDSLPKPSHQLPYDNDSLPLQDPVTTTRSELVPDTQPVTSDAPEWFPSGEEGASEYSQSTLATLEASATAQTSLSNEEPPSFPFAADTSSVDWMATASPLQSANHEPVTATGDISTEPLLQASSEEPLISARPAPDVSQDHLQTDIQTFDAEPVEIQKESFPWTTQDADPTSALPWDAPGSTTDNPHPSTTTLPWDTHDTAQDEGDAGLWERQLANPDTVAEAHEDTNVEDSWAKAFADPDSGLDDSWNAAFATGFDDDGFLDDGFLEDEPQPTSLPAASPYIPSSFPDPAPATTAPFPPKRTSSTNAPTASPYAAAPPVQPNVHQHSTSSAPMQFFAELPTQPVRSKKPRALTPSQPLPSAPPPAAAAPPRSQQPQPIEPPKPTQDFAPFRQPERMEMFPAQPSVPVSTPHLSSPGLAQGPPPSQQSQSASRYSPSLPASAPYSNEPPNASSAASRYASAPIQVSQPPSTATGPPPPQSATTSKYSYAPTTNTQPPRQSSYVRQPSLSGPQATSPPQPAVPMPAASSPSATSTTASRAPPPPGPPPNPFAPRTSSPLAHSGFRSIDDQSAPASRPPQGPSAAARYSPAPTAQPAQNTSSISPGSGISMPAPASPGETTTSTTNFVPAASLARARTSSPKSFEAALPERRRSYDGRSVVAPGPTASIIVPSHIHSQPATVMDFVLPTDETMHDPLERWKGSAIFCWGPGGLAVSSLPKHIPRYGGGQSAPQMKPVAGEIKIQRTKDVLATKDQLPPFPGPLKSKAKKKDLISWLSSSIALFEQHFQTDTLDPVLSIQKEEKLILWKIVRVLLENDGVLTGNLTVEAASRQVLVQGLKHDNEGEPAPFLSNSTTQSSAPSSSGEIETIKRLLLEGNREKAVWHAVDHRLWAHAMLLSSTALPAVWKQVVQEFVRQEIRNSGPNHQSMAALYQVIAGNWDDSIDELVPLSARSGFQMMSTATTPAQSRDAFDGLNKWRETLNLMISNGSPDDGKAIVALGKLLAGSGRIEAAHVCFVFARSHALFGGADDPNTNFSLLGVDHANLWSGSAIDLQAIQLSEAYELGLTLSPSGNNYYAPHLQAYKFHHALSLADTGSRNEALQYCEAIASATKSMTRLSPYCHATLASQLDDLQRRLSQSPKDGSSSWMSRPTMSKMSSSMGTWFTSFVAGDEAETASTGSGAHSEQEPGPFAHISGNTPIVSRSASIVDLQSAANYASIGSHPPSKYAPSFQQVQRSAAGDEAGSHSAPSPFSASPETNKSAYSPRQSNEALSHTYGSPPKPANVTRYSSQLSQPHSYFPMARSDSSISRPSYEPYVPAVPEELSSSYQPTGGGSYLDETASRSAEYAPTMADKSNGTPPTNGYGPSSATLQPTPPLGGEGHSSYAPSQDQEISTGYQGGNDYQATQNSYTPSMGGYEPLSDGYAPPNDSYAPPSYQPYDSEPQTENHDNGPKAKSMMDEDDNDLAARAAALKQQERSAADKATDDAFRAAAEADAARDKTDKRSSSGWFSGIGGLFGGSAKKDAGLNAPTVHKAKLGEENSFYFDKDLNKWVNRKSGSSSPASAAGVGTPPPPPRASAPPSAPPSRNISMAAGPPQTSAPSGSEGTLKLPPSGLPMQGAMSSGPPSRIGTPGSLAESATSSTVPLDTGSSGPSMVSSSGVAPPSQGATPSGPPSRPAMSMNDANSLDDLIGGPQARKGGTIKKGKKGQRYVDVMAK